MQSPRGTLNALVDAIRRELRGLRRRRRILGIVQSTGSDSRSFFRCTTSGLQQPATPPRFEVFVLRRAMRACRMLLERREPRGSWARVCELI